MAAPRVTVVDYGMGNLLSVRRALEHLGAEVEISSEAAGWSSGTSTLSSTAASRSLAMARIASCRLRSFVTPIALPTSSKLIGSRPESNP